MPSSWKHLKNFYNKYERHISSLSLVVGFVFDAVTLKRVDLLWENVWIGGRLVIVAFCIILLNFYDVRRRRKENLTENELEIRGTIHFLLIILIQFSFGGLFSAFMIFYFRSATLATSWPFLLLLALVFIFNELFKKHYIRLTFQISVFFIALFSFAIYSVPVVLHQIGDWVFILSGVISLLILGIFVFVIKITTQEKFRQSKKLLIVSITLIFATINTLYFTNLIPPIPLSLKESGVFHSLTRNSSGDYDVLTESRTFVEKISDYFDLYETYHNVDSQTVYAYSAIFSPTNLNISVVHEWQYYNVAKKLWITTNTITLPIVGGRDGGFRTYSTRTSLTEGRWRVNILTLRKQIIGRIKFDVVNVPENVALERKVMK